MSSKRSAEDGEVNTHKRAKLDKYSIAQKRWNILREVSILKCMYFGQDKFGLRFVK